MRGHENKIVDSIHIIAFFLREIGILPPQLTKN